MPVHAFQDYSGGQTDVRVGSGPSYIALSQQKSGGSQPPAELPHFCWGVEDFNIDRIMRALSEMQAPAQAVLREGKTINGVNFTDPDGFPLQFNPINACGGAGFLGDRCDAGAKVTPKPGDPPPIAVRTLNHVRLMVPNLRRSTEWYQRLTGMPVLPDSRGIRLRVGTGPQFVGLIEGAGPAAYRPHVGFGVAQFDADRILKNLSDLGVKTRRVMRGTTAEVLVEAPDGVEIQLQDLSYCGGSGVLGNVCS
jgi:catechol 2,3-dioxygenase-like lactoylglutathione lyase family enzyme